MKKGTVTRLFRLVLLLVMAAVLLPKTALAATYNVESGEEYTATTGDKFTFTLSSEKDVAIIGDETLEIWYGANSEASDSKLDLSQGAAIETLDGRTWYFRVKSGRGTISFTWDEANDEAARATEFSLKAGESRSFKEKGMYRYYLLHVTDPSAKYTFKADNGGTDIQFNEGKLTAWKSAPNENRVPDGSSKTFLLKKGYYTICGICSEQVEVTFTREKWTGISKLTPDNDGKIVGTVGTKFDYKVYYEPKNADSKISVKSASFGSNTRMKLKSKSNGVAVFEVDFTNDEANKQYTLPYKNNETTRSYNRVQFTSEEGVTAIAEKMAGPEAPELYGTMTGSTKAVSIPVTAHPNANKFVAYVKTKKKGWVYTGETSTNENGIYYVNCKKLNPGKKYTFRVYAYADGIKGGYLEVKGVTAYNLKPTKCKAVAKKAKFVKRKKDYEWRFNWTRGWYKVGFTDYTVHTVKISYKIPKKASGMYVTVNGKKLKSGKKLTFTLGGKTKAGKKTPIIFQTVRKSGKCIAYGPTVKVKCKLKKAK